MSQSTFHLDLPLNDFEFAETIDSDSGPSSFVGSVSFDDSTGIMDVTLNGKSYSYPNTSRRIFDSWKGASSRGAFYNRSIKGQLTESCSPCELSAASEFEGLTGVQIDPKRAKAALEVYRDGRLILPKKQMPKKEKMFQEMENYVKLSEAVQAGKKLSKGNLMKFFEMELQQLTPGSKQILLQEMKLDKEIREAIQ